MYELRGRGSLGWESHSASTGGRLRRSVTAQPGDDLRGHRRGGPLRGRGSRTAMDSGTGRALVASPPNTSHGARRATRDSGRWRGRSGQNSHRPPQPSYCLRSRNHCSRTARPVWPSAGAPRRRAASMMRSAESRSAMSLWHGVSRSVRADLLLRLWARAVIARP
jgi:hypothetical protein